MLGREVGKGDELEAFCQQTYPKLVGALDLYLGDVHIAEELAQEALVRAAKRWSRVGDLDSPGGWTYRVAMNLAKSWFRRRRAEARAYARIGVTDDVESDVGTAVSDRSTVRRAVGSLPEAQRAAVVCRYYLGLSGPEAADALGISHDAVRARTKRAIAALREALGHEIFDAEEAHDAV